MFGFVRPPNAVGLVIGTDVIAESLNFGNFLYNWDFRLNGIVGPIGTSRLGVCSDYDEDFVAGTR